MNTKQLKDKYDLSELELFTQSTSGYKVSFTANKLKQTESVHTSGSAVRLIKNNKIGFSANYGTNSFEETIVHAIETSEFSPKINIELPGNNSFNENTKKVKEISLSEYLNNCKAKGNSIIEEIQNEAPDVLTDISFDLGYTYENIKNSKELEYSHSNETHYCLINIRDTDENDFIDIYTAITDDKFPDYKPYLSELLKSYKLSKKHAKIKSGKLPVLFTSKASKELFSLVEVALNGKQINQKASPWHDKLNQKVLSNLITIKQDPSFGYMTRAVDDEGNKTQTLLLINKGVLECFYFDLTSSSRAALQCSSTGNGFKPSLTSQPEPNLLNMLVSCGKKTLNEIIKSTDYGLLVDQTMGGLTTNISGDMSVNVDIGFLIEKGKLIGRVKDVMISGNIYNALNNVIELSNTPKWYWSNIYSPDILVEGFTVSAKN